MANDFSIQPAKSEAECNRLKPPTAAEIKEIKTIFKDFGIIKDMPLFRTYAELDIFRRSAIKTAFA